MIYLVVCFQYCDWRIVKSLLWKIIALARYIQLTEFCVDFVICRHNVLTTYRVHLHSTCCSGYGGSNCHGMMYPAVLNWTIIDFTSLCFSPVFRSYILSKWRQLHTSKHLCVPSWMEWCQVYNRYFQLLGVTVTECMLVGRTTHTQNTEWKFCHETHLVSLHIGISLCTRWYIPMRYQHCLPIY